MSGVDISLNLLQATALANEVNLAKNLATTSVSLSNTNTDRLTNINNKLNIMGSQVLTLTQKLESLCNKLETARSANGGFSSQDYSFSNL